MNWLMLATMGPIGYLPAPGTCATIATLLLVYLLSYLSMAWYGAILFLLLLVGWYSADRAVHALRHPDPSCVVIDECVGTLITFMGLSLSLPLLMVGTLVFRFLDITKWCGIWRCQQLPLAWGVMMDDIVAGLLSCLILHLLRWQGIV